MGSFTSHRIAKMDNIHTISIEVTARAGTKQKERPFPDQKAKAKKGQDLGPPTAAGIHRLKQHPNPVHGSTIRNQ